MKDINVECIDKPDIIRGKDFYYKLHKCLKIAMSNDELSCHVNHIIVHLGKNIESQFTYYDSSFDIWCDYFLSMNEK